jgi:hypothetical protein
MRFHGRETRPERIAALSDSPANGLLVSSVARFALVLGLWMTSIGYLTVYKFTLTGVD